MSAPRLIKIVDGVRLSPGDNCYFYGEYVAGAGWQHGGFNNLISNLKSDIASKPQRRPHKQRAIEFAATLLGNGSLNLDALRTSVTMVPMPCSKPLGHPKFDDRVTQVLARLGRQIGPGFDLREALVTVNAREAQHEHPGEARPSVDELAASMQLDPRAIATPLRPHVVVVDDVFTLGSSFVAAKRLLMEVEGVQSVTGVFIARTVWPTPDFSAFFDVVND